MLIDPIPLADLQIADLEEKKPMCSLSDLTSDCWNIINLHKQQRLKTVEYLFYALPIIFIVEMLICCIHEVSHATFILAFNGVIREIVFFPATLWMKTNSGGYVTYIGEFTETELYIIAMAGTMGTILTGTLILIIIYKMKLNPVVEYFGIIFFGLCIIELIVYPLSDIMNLEFNYATDFYGDWQKAIEIFPITRVFIVIIIIFYVIGFIITLRWGLFKKIQV